MARMVTEPLTFISGDARSQAAQEAIRVHVMRRQHRQRRQRQERKKLTYEHIPSDISFNIWAPADTSQASPPTWPTPASHIRTPESNASVSSDTELSQLCPEEVFAFAQSEGLIAEISNGEALLGKRNYDSPESMLVQHYLKYGGGSKVTHDFFRAYCETTATYSAFLAMVATNYSDEEGRPPPVNPTELENLALREVAEQLSRSPTAPPTNIMLAVALLANLKECRNEKELVIYHWNALHRMVDINGGIDRFRMHQSLYAYLFWMEAVVLGIVETSIGRPRRDVGTNSDSKQEAVEFLQGISTQTCKLTDHGTEQCARLTTPILEVFSVPPHKKDVYATNKWRRGRLACLTFLAAISFSTGSAIHNNSVYQAIEAEVIDRQQRYPIYPEELYYLFVRECNQDHLCSLVWKVARLVCAIKQLEQRDLHTCHRLLCAYLKFQDPFAVDMAQEDMQEFIGRFSLND